VKYNFILKKKYSKIDFLFSFISQNIHFLLILSVYITKDLYSPVVRITTTSISIKPSNIFCRCVAHHLSSQNRIYESYSKLMHDRTISNREAMHKLNKTKSERGELIELIAFVRYYLYVPIHAMHFSTNISFVFLVLQSPQRSLKR